MSHNIVEQLNEFFARPGINKSGICQEAGIHVQHLNMALLQKRFELSDEMKDKLLPIIRTYGFKG